MTTVRNFYLAYTTEGYHLLIDVYDSFGVLVGTETRHIVSSGSGNEFYVSSGKLDDILDAAYSEQDRVEIHRQAMLILQSLEL